MTEVPISTQQLLAIVSASGIGRASVSVSFTSEVGSADAYEQAIALIEAAGGVVERVVHPFVWGDYETATIQPDAGRSDTISLHGPIGHVGYQPDEQITPTPEGKLALRVLEGGVA